MKRHPAARSRRLRRRVLRFETLESRSLLATVASFDNDRWSAPYAVSIAGSDPGPAELAGGVIPGAAAEYLRLYSGVTNNLNGISFARTDAGVYEVIIADFDFRLTQIEDRPDGLSLVFLNTMNYGLSGPGPAGGSEPRYAGSLGIGLDTYRNEGDPSGDTVKIFYDAQLVEQMDVSHMLDMAGGHWIHARIMIAGDRLSLQLTPSAGSTKVVFDSLSIPGYTPYESRSMFTGWSGGAAWGNGDIDNVNVQYTFPASAVFSMSPRTATVDETGSVQLTVERAGNLAGTVSVRYATQAVSAAGGIDYRSVSGILNFGPNIQRKTIFIPLINDSRNEAHEQFVVTLSSPSLGAILSGPDRKAVTIVDDERGRSIGDFSDVLPLPNSMIHAILLPTYEVLSFDQETGHHGGWLWNPLSGESRKTSMPPEGSHPFCTGHTLLTNGHVFFAGGHEGFIESGNPQGLRMVMSYDPFSDTWEMLPDMEHGRWYPTVVAMPSGDVVVMGGYDETGTNTTNRQIEIYRHDGAGWSRRNLDVAQDLEDNNAAHDGYLYPRMFLAPDGRIFVLGAGSQTWWLDLAAEGTSGLWTTGPSTIAPFTRNDYGTASMIEPGKILLTGGGGDLEGNAPQAGAELIDLNVASPQWRVVDSLPGGGRRHLNTTILPGGDVLVTGGTRSVGFNTAAGDARQALHWKPAAPAGSQWETWDSAASPRLYHATALLLPSGKVLTAGSGQPHAEDSWDQRNAEVFSPRYIYQTGRPRIKASPGVVNYGQRILLPLSTTSLSQVVLMKLGSVTHSLEENARRVPLSWKKEASGIVNVNLPTNINAASPGHYLLFVIDNRGVPSEGRMIQLLPAVAPVPAPASLSVAASTFSSSSTTAASGNSAAPAKVNTGHSPTALSNSQPVALHPPPRSGKEFWIDRILAEETSGETDFIGPLLPFKSKR